MLKKPFPGQIEVLRCARKVVHFGLPLKTEGMFHSYFNECSQVRDEYTQEQVKGEADINSWCGEVQSTTLSVHRRR